MNDYYEKLDYLLKKGFIGDGYFYHLTESAVREYNDIRYVKSCMATTGYCETHVRNILKGNKNVNLETCVYVLTGLNLDVNASNMEKCFDFDLDAYEDNEDFEDNEIEMQIQELKDKIKELKRKKRL